MSFNNEGDIPVVISNGMVAESILSKGPVNQTLDIALEVKTEDGYQGDWWRGNLSAAYTKIKNRSGQTCSQVTYENLVSLGYQGPDFSQWPNNPNVDWNAVQNALLTMAGIATSAHVARNGDYFNIRYLGGSGGNKPKAVDFSQIMPQQQAQPMQQQAQAQPQAQPQQQAQQGGFGGQQPQQGQGGFGNPNPQQNQGGFGG